MAIFHSYAALFPAFTSKDCVLSLKSKSSEMSLSVIGSINCKRTSPLRSFSETLAILALKTISSFSLKKRGALGNNIKSFWVTASSMIVPVARSLVCAIPKNFHLVNDSGTLNENTTSPLSFVFSCG